MVRCGLIFSLAAVMAVFGFGGSRSEAQEAGPAAQQGAPARAVGQQAGRPAAPTVGTSFPEEYLVGDAADVIALERRIEAAVVRGDTAYLNGVVTDDFVFVHGDGWTTGGKPLARDDKAAFVKRAAEKQYLVHDLDDVKIEMHGNLAITYGRYISLYAPPETRGQGPAPSLTSIWFERIFEKRDGKWMWVSHRTVYGPVPSPAGVDPTELTPGYQASYVPGLPLANVAPKKYEPSSPEAAAVLELDQKLNACVPVGDWQFFDSVTADDFAMIHSDDWTRGGGPRLMDSKATFMQRIKDKQYLALDGDSVQVEMHGDIALTFGRYLATLRGSAERAPKTAWFSVWFERGLSKAGWQMDVYLV